MSVNYCSSLICQMIAYMGRLLATTFKACALKECARYHPIALGPSVNYCCGGSKTYKLLLRSRRVFVWPCVSRYSLNITPYTRICHAEPFQHEGFAPSTQRVVPRGVQVDRGPSVVRERRHDSGPGDAQSEHNAWRCVEFV